LAGVTGGVAQFLVFFAEFKKLIDEMVKVNSEIPGKSQNGSA